MASQGRERPGRGACRSAEAVSPPVAGPTQALQQLLAWTDLSVETVPEVPPPAGGLFLGTVVLARASGHSLGAVLDRPGASLAYNIVRVNVDTGDGEVWLRCLDNTTKRWMAKVVPGRTDQRAVWRVRTGWKRPAPPVSEPQTPDPRFASRHRDEILMQNDLIVRDRLEAIGVRAAKPLFLPHEDLAGRSLSGEMLDGSDLEGANLSDAKLIGTSLRKARLQGAILIGADLSRADLREADLSGAQLLGTDLRAADLRGSILWRTKLVGAQLDELTLLEAKPFGSALPGQAFHSRFHRTSEEVVIDVAWHPSREILASGHADCLILWDANSGLEILRLEGHQHYVQSV